MTHLESRELSKKKQKQFKETNFEIFSYAVVLHVCCILFHLFERLEASNQLS